MNFCPVQAQSDTESADPSLTGGARSLLSRKDEEGPGFVTGKELAEVTDGEGAET